MPKAKSAKSATAPKAPRRTRVRKQPGHKSFRLSKKIPTKPLSSPWAITKKASRILLGNKKLFAMIIVSLALLNFVVVQSFGNPINLASVKENVETLLGSSATKANTSWILFGSLVGSGSSQAGEVAGVYQTILMIIFSLAIIWALRQLLSGEKTSFRDAFYKSTYPLIPFCLVLVVIGLQMLPATVGSLIYSTVLANDLVANNIERTLWIMLYLVLVLLSAYMILSSIFALYISTLPDMTPLKALRSARSLVLGRRLKVAIRFLFLLIVTSVVSLLILLPTVFFAPSIAEYVFYVFASAILVVIHSYTYILYRELL